MYMGTVSGSTPIATTAAVQTTSVEMSTGRMPNRPMSRLVRGSGDGLAERGRGEHEARGAVRPGLLLDVQQEREREHPRREPCGQLGGDDASDARGLEEFGVASHGGSMLARRMAPAGRRAGGLGEISLAYITQADRMSVCTRSTSSATRCAAASSTCWPTASGRGRRRRCRRGGVRHHPARRVAAAADPARARLRDGARRGRPPHLRARPRGRRRRYGCQPGAPRLDVEVSAALVNRGRPRRERYMSSRKAPDEEERRHDG